MGDALKVEWLLIYDLVVKIVKLGQFCLCSGVSCNENCLHLICSSNFAMQTPQLELKGI